MRLPIKSLVQKLAAKRSGPSARAFNGTPCFAIKNEDDITVLAQAMCDIRQGDPKMSDMQSLGSAPGRISRINKLRFLHEFCRILSIMHDARYLVCCEAC